MMSAPQVNKALQRVGHGGSNSAIQEKLSSSVFEEFLHSLPYQHFSILEVVSRNYLLLFCSQFVQSIQ